MGDIAWVRKYRPSSFDDYIGDDVKNLVVNRFKNRANIPNTIMLYGTRGTGKTSMARLLCKEILCTDPVDGHSCGKCDMCEEITQYITSTEAGVECTGITEVDAATTTGKSDINDIIEDALIPPMYPLKHKVIIMDECHMLSTSAQNSLLKVIEEPPEHLIFILCTTDPEKVINTIRSRIQLKLEVRKKSVDEMADKLLQISKLEGLTTSKEALQIIAKKGDRVPRECIMLLESVAKSCGNEVTIENVRRALGNVATELYVQYFEAANNSLASILRFNKVLIEKDVAAKDFMSGLIRFLLDALYVKHGINIEDFSIDFVKQVKNLFDMYNSSEFDALLQIVEGATRSIDSDDTKSELIITNTAMRIGKVNMIARGIAGQAEVARDENIASVRRYSQLLEEQQREKISKVPEVDLKKEQIASVFTHMAEVRDGNDVMSDMESTDGVIDETEGMSDDAKRVYELFKQM